MWQHPRIYTRYEGNKKCSLLQTELKGLMDHTAYLILKSCGPWEDPCHIIQLSAAALSLCPWLRPAEERQTDRGGGEGEPPHLWVSLLPRKPCLAYLTPVSDDITRQDSPLTMRDFAQY